MGVFRHTLTVLNRTAQSTHRRATQDERSRLKSIYILFKFFRNNCFAR